MTWKRTNSGAAVYVNVAPGSKETADYLDDLKRNASSFLSRAIEFDPGDPRLIRIRDNWTGEFSEMEFGSKNIAHSIAKSDVHMCVRDRSGNLADTNAAMYVLLHEFAHIATEEIGHTDTFWKNFRYILEIAERLGMYKLHAKTETLCDRKIGESPLVCVRNGNCESQLAMKNI